MHVPNKPFKAPMMPRMPDQENMDAHIVAKRLKPRLKISATECRIVRQLSMSQSRTHLQLCFHCVICQGEVSVNLGWQPHAIILVFSMSASAIGDAAITRGQSLELHGVATHEDLLISQTSHI